MTIDEWYETWGVTLYAPMEALCQVLEWAEDDDIGLTDDERCEARAWIRNKATEA